MCFSVDDVACLLQAHAHANISRTTIDHIKSPEYFDIFSTPKIEHLLEPMGLLSNIYTFVNFTLLTLLHFFKNITRPEVTKLDPHATFLMSCF